MKISQRSTLGFKMQVCLFFFIAIPRIGQTQTVIVTEPDGISDDVAEGRDFAKWELGNPWDMDGTACPDMVWEDRFDCDIVTTETVDVAAEMFSGSGTYQGTAATNDPRFWLIFPGFKSVVRLANGHRFPIDSSVYRFFSAKLKVNGSAKPPPLNDAPMQVHFSQGVFFSTDPFGLTFPDGPNGTGRVPQGGFQIVRFDLVTQTDPTQRAWTSFPSWPGLRIDPTNETGVSFEFDWIRVTAPGSASNKKTVQWTAMSTGSDTFSVDAVDSTGAAYEVVSGLPAGTTSFDADVSPLPPGAYTIRVRSSSGTTGSSCSGCLVINEAPNMYFVQPDKAGDTVFDYATVVALDPWGPFEPGEVAAMSVENQSFAGGVYTANNVAGDRDARLFMNTPIPIDGIRYRLLSYTFQLSGTRDIGDGSVTRILFGDDPSTLAAGDDIVIEEGLNTYVVGDLEEMPLEGGAIGAWEQVVPIFRFDPHEFAEPRTFELHQVKLAPLDQADPIFDIEWADTDPDDDASVELFYDLDRTPDNGNEQPINDGIPLTEDADGGGDVYSWNPHADGVLPGKYYIFGRVADAMSTLDRYATGQLLVTCSSSSFPPLMLSSGGVTGTVIEASCETITAGPYSIESSGRVTFIAGEQITLTDGFSVVQGGEFTAIIEPLLAPN